jgi:tRNA(Ile2) C34 agmatinyltransferase TiaS
MSAALAAPAPPVGRSTGLTLERRLEGALAEAGAHGHAECPVCGGAMAGEAEELRCEGCGSRLS